MPPTGMNQYVLTLKPMSDEQILEQFPVSAQTQEDDDFTTPLIAVVEMGRVSLVRRMLERGFSARANTALGSPIGAAIHSQKPHALEILQALLEQVGTLEDDAPWDYCPDLNEPTLHAAIRCGNAGPVRLLLAHGADPAWRDADSVSALELAEEMGNPEICEAVRKAAGTRKGRPKKSAGTQPPVDCEKLEKQLDEMSQNFLRWMQKHGGGEGKDP